MLGTSKPDVLFTHSTGQALMDITTVSDRGLDQQNSIDKLTDRLVDVVMKRGLDSGHFGLQVKGNWRDLTIGGPKPQLSIPRPRDSDSAIFNDQFDEYLNHIQISPEVRWDFSGAGPDVEMTISHNPTQKYFSVNHLSYTVPFSATQNTVYAALEAKANQLKSSQFTGLKSVLLCDGGCAVMSPRAQKGQGLDARDIISTFLSNYRAVDFVLAILIDGDSSGLSGPDHLRVITKAYVLRADNPAMSLVGYLNERLALNLPNPENIPINAYGLENEGKTFNGGGVMAGQSIKMSSRAVMSLLSGQTSQEDFMRDNPHVKERFAQAVREGRMLKEAKIESCPQRDDDWIEFNFSEPDPAVSMFPNLRSGIE
jgi:hypothetical protein